MTESERKTIELLRRYCAEKILYTADGYAITVGRLCELALSGHLADEALEYFVIQRGRML